MLRSQQRRRRQSFFRREESPALLPSLLKSQPNDRSEGYLKSYISYGHMMGIIDVKDFRSLMRCVEVDFLWYKTSKPTGFLLKDREGLPCVCAVRNDNWPASVWWKWIETTSLPVHAMKTTNSAGDRDALNSLSMKFWASVQCCVWSAALQDSLPHSNNFTVILFQSIWTTWLNTTRGSVCDHLFFVIWVNWLLIPLLFLSSKNCGKIIAPSSF